jgi:hypothetical protein
VWTHVGVEVKERMPRIGQPRQHGTGHGVGSFLNVHEGFQPSHTICQNNRQNKWFWFSHQLGVRPRRVRCTKQDESWYDFERLTCVPIQTRMCSAIRRKSGYATTTAGVSIRFFRTTSVLSNGCAERRSVPSVSRLQDRVGPSSIGGSKG